MDEFHCNKFKPRGQQLRNCFLPSSPMSHHRPQEILFTTRALPAPSVAPAKGRWDGGFASACLSREYYFLRRMVLPLDAAST